MDNRVDNLEILTHQQNMQRIQDRRKPMSQEDVLDIRYRREAGQGIWDIAEEYGVSHTTISRISRGLTYPEFAGPRTHGASGWEDGLRRRHEQARTLND